MTLNEFLSQIVPYVFVILAALGTWLANRGLREKANSALTEAKAVRERAEAATESATAGMQELVTRKMGEFDDERRILQKRLDEQAQVVVKLRTELDEEKKARQDERSDFERREREAQRQNEMLTDQIDKLRQQADSFTTRLDEMAAQLSDASLKLSQATEKEQQYMAENTELRTQLATVTAERDGLKTQRDDLQTLIKEKEAEEEHNATKLAALLQQMRDMVTRLDETEAHVKRLRELISLREGDGK